MSKRKPWVSLLTTYPQSEKVNSLSIGAEMMYLRLVASSDDQGCYYGDPPLLMAYLLGHRLRNHEVSRQKVDIWTEELERARLLERYATNGQTYVHLLDFFRWNRADYKPNNRFPKPTQDLILPAVHEIRTEPDRNPYGNRSESVREPIENRSPSSSSSSTTTTTTTTPTLASARVSADKPPTPPCENTPYSEIMDQWNKTATEAGLPQVRRLSKKRKAKVKTRWADAEFRNQYATVLDRIRGSPFLCGDNDRGWKADFDWLFTNDTNWLKILEGKYGTDRQTAQAGAGERGQAGGRDRKADADKAGIRERRFREAEKIA